MGIKVVLRSVAYAVRFNSLGVVLGHRSQLFLTDNKRSKPVYW